MNIFVSIMAALSGAIGAWLIYIGLTTFEISLPWWMFSYIYVGIFWVGYRYMSGDL